MAAADGPRVRIESDGTPMGTRMFFGDEEIPNVLDLKWAMGWETPGMVTVTLDNVDVALKQDASRWSKPDAVATKRKDRNHG